MLRRLIARLTGDPERGRAMFERAVSRARRPDWYVEGGVPDTPEGRFAMLSTVFALVIVRLEAAGASGEAASVALTERFVEAMDAEVRQMGVSDPSIGKQVRSLVGALSRRVGLWREAVGGDDWSAAIADSVYRDTVPGPAQRAHAEAGLRAYWAELQGADPAAVANGDAP